MGLFRFLKKINASRKSFAASRREWQEKNAMYLKMSTEELSDLSKDELLDAVWARTEHTVSSFENVEEGFRSLNNEQRVFYALYYFEMEVNNGGICQFFVNSSRIVAPVVSEYLGMIGAVEHKELLDAFVEKHRINVKDLSSFEIKTVKDYQLQYERFPFKEYDNAFYELESLENRLIPFVKEHIEEF